MGLTDGQFSIIERLFGPQNVPQSNVLKQVGSQTNINQIRGVTQSGATGAGIPKHVTRVSASTSSASAGATSNITVNFQRDPNDKAFSNAVIYVKGYQGNNVPTQVGYSADSPVNIVLNNTGESVSLIVQATGNGGSAPLNTAPSCGIRLPTNNTGGFGTSTTTNLTKSQVIAISGGSTAGANSSSGAVTSPATLNVSTAGTKDWLVLTGPFSSTIPTFDDTQWHWKALGGYLRRSFHQVIPTPEAQSTVTSPMAVSSNAGDDTSSNNPLSAGNPNWGPLSAWTTVNIKNANNSGGTNINWGYILEAPADTTSRTLTVYIVVQSGAASAGTVTLTGHLSDGSASDATVNLSPATGSYNWYKVPFTFNAASAGQRYVLSILVTALGDTATALGFQAATLS